MDHVYTSVLLDTFFKHISADSQHTSVITTALSGVADAQHGRDQKVAGFIDVHDV